MKLEEAKEQLESLKESIKSSIEEPTDVEDVFVQDVQAIETVLQELERLQKENELARKTLIENSNIADERNDLLVEVQKLKKENEELRIERNGYRAQVNSAFDNGFIHKDKIREKIEKIKDKKAEDMFITATQSKLNTIFALEDLLKEE